MGPSEFLPPQQPRQGPCFSSELGYLDIYGIMDVGEGEMSNLTSRIVARGSYMGTLSGNSDCPVKTWVKMLLGAIPTGRCI